MDIKYFLIGNKSGYKSREAWFQKNHIDEYNNIIDYTNNDELSTSTFKEKIWVFYNKLISKPKCSGCDKYVEFSGRFDRGYNDFCSLQCANDNKDNIMDRIKKSNNDKWGVDFFPQHKSFVSKVKNTKLSKYGDKNYNNKEKNQKTKLDRYGDKNYNNIDKAKITYIDRYGVDNPSKSEKVIDRIKKSNNKKYGCNSYTQSIQCKEDRRNLFISKLKK